jgi:hypothetical protein
LWCFFRVAHSDFDFSLNGEQIHGFVNEWRSNLAILNGGAPGRSAGNNVILKRTVAFESVALCLENEANPGGGLIGAATFQQSLQVVDESVIATGCVSNTRINCGEMGENAREWSRIYWKSCKETIGNPISGI